MSDDPLQQLEEFIILVLSKASVVFQSFIIVIFVTFLLLLGFLFLIFKSAGLV